MSAGAILRTALLAGLALAASGCVLYRGPRGVEDALERQLGVELEREFGVKLGWTSTKLALSFARGDDDDSMLDFDLDGIGVATYTLPRGAKRPRLDASSLGLSGWETAIRSRDADGDVLLLTRERRGRVRALVFVVVDGDEVVLGRLEGDLSDLVAKMVRDTERGGTRAARRALPVAN